MTDQAPTKPSPADPVRRRFKLERGMAPCIVVVTTLVVERIWVTLEWASTGVYVPAVTNVADTTVVVCLVWIFRDLVREMRLQTRLRD